MSAFLFFVVVAKIVVSLPELKGRFRAHFVGIIKVEMHKIECKYSRSPYCQIITSINYTGFGSCCHTELDGVTIVSFLVSVIQ